MISKSLKFIFKQSIYTNYESDKLNYFIKRIVSGSDVLKYKKIDQLYSHVITQIPYSEEVVIDGFKKDSKLDYLKPEFGNISAIEMMMATDTVNYLPDDILTKVDRAAMKTSLETRVPFLDHEIIEFTWSLPISYKIKDGLSKWPLHEILKEYIPEQLTKRENMGFSVPIQ